ncbi:hypothetical protein [Amycolatopsis keratiniphila]|uniref:Uncharacterized protein n=1 Tax=Amycolatopsis keratiniphila subsp. keratiniphila TaxID=227715 RepID=A0A1W2M1N5_9PSEU|nr:hypothetical protein [Amycolatopsis keratiniphila]OLZ52711.1 hypothetical protein BS330_22725 [Amycolatopsis keratiniphila subsp. nogabecina]ONF73763.1 hypothetical protein AVR91_0206590 [Amycolatopsis keratiniphila subsp. keratiniphila]SDU09767.1 hypothetical protein SAMN04489733_1106 [Amycolatopsis keratiniphila]
MKFPRAITTLAIAAGLATTLAPAAAAETVASLDFVAEHGAHPVSGRSGHWAASPENEVRFWERGATLRVDAETDRGFDYIMLDFTAPSGNLQAGTYSHAEGAHILAVSNGLGCVDDYSTFTIDRIERGAEGLIALDATFEQRCGSPTSPALRGEVHYRR